MNPLQLPDTESVNESATALDTPIDTAPAAPQVAPTSWLRRLWGGPLVVVDYLLSPLCWWGVGIPLAALVTLVALGLLVAAYPTLPAWDAAFLLRLHRYASPACNRSVAVLTNLGTYWGVLPASIGLTALALWYRRWSVAIYLTLVMAGSAALNLTAKLLWHRVRPALWEGIPPHADFSFPSGHATYSMTFVLALVLINWDSPRRPWLIRLGGLFALAIGFSRVYLGVHFPSDIVGGWLLAIAWAVGLYQLVFRRGPLWQGLKTDPEERSL